MQAESFARHRRRRARHASLLLALALATAACSGSSSSSPTTNRVPVISTTTTTAPMSAVQLATAAYVWGYPLVVTERTLQSLARLVPVNHLTVQPKRSDATSRTIVAPNTDTLYAVAPLDLRGEPFVLTLPAIHDRYYAFQFISAYSDSFAYIGTRATAGRAGRWAVTPPGWHGRLPAGVTRIASPTPQLLMLGRFLVVDDADVANVHALARHIALEPLSTVAGTAPAAPPPPIGAPEGTPQAIAASGPAFFDELGDALAINPPTDPVERATLARFAPLGIGPGQHPSAEHLAASASAALAAGVRNGDREIVGRAAAPAHVVGSWTYNLDIGTYGHDALLRALVAKAGWGANIPAEAVYAHAAVDGTGSSLSGAHRYILRFPPGGLPPVNAFWSVTLYGPDRFFVANSINRFAIGDRTAGLRYGPGGSLDLYIQHDPPAGHESNWLPTPAGAFSLTLRLYLPKSAVLHGQYAYPGLNRAA